jgi:hypothetical protein
MPLPLLLLAPLAKVALGKLLVAGVAHASPTVLTHAGMIAAQNVTASAVATGTVSGAAGVAAGAAHDAYRLSRKVERYRKKHGIDENGKRITPLLPSEEKLMRLIETMMSHYYARRYHWDYDGTHKTQLCQIDTCKSCNCSDYDDVLQSRASLAASEHKCYCGHIWGMHSKQEETEWLYKKFAEEFYETCNNVEHDGTMKTKLSQIDKCNSCDCPDFDRKSSLQDKMCDCGHGWVSHSRSPDKWQWIVVWMAIRHAKEIQEDEDSDSSDSGSSDNSEDGGDYEEDDEEDDSSDDGYIDDSYDFYDY